MKRIIIFAAVICAAAADFLLLRTFDVMGIPDSQIMDDMRKRARITDDWEFSQSGDEKLVAGVAYAPDRSDASYYLYLARGGFSFGYRFRQGGNLLPEMGIRGFDCGEFGTAYLSMNEQRTELIEIDDGENLWKIDVDPEKPFTEVVPKNGGEVRFFDENGTEVQIDAIETVVRE